MKRSIRKVKRNRKAKRETVNKELDIKIEADRKKRKLGRVERLRLWYKELKSKKVCYVCGENRSITLDFHHVEPKKKKLSISRMVSTGRSKIAILEELKLTVAICSNCHRKLHQNERVEKKKGLSETQRLIRELKTGKKCFYCGEKEICALDWHHIDPSTKLFSVGNAIKMKLSREEIIKEVEKCVLCCSNHHRLLHGYNS